MLAFESPLARTVIGCAIEVHRHLGPGLLESSYQRCLTHELSIHGVSFVSQKPLPLMYKGVSLDCGYRLDFVIEGTLVVEAKAIDQLAPIHIAQVRTYLRLLNVPHGLLINFHVVRLADGIRSILRHPLGTDSSSVPAGPEGSTI